MDVWHGIVEAMRAEGVKFLFSIRPFPGHPLKDDPDIKWIQIRYEGSGPFMAMAYARLSGGAGVTTSEPGPGLTNMASGVLEAYSACSPIILPCSSTTQELDGMGAFMECDQVEVMKPITKWSVRIARPERVPWYTHRAFSVALNGKPGPVYLDIPQDVGSPKLNIKMQKYTPITRIRTRGDLDRIREAINLLVKAERPVVVAGGGAVLSRAFNEFKNFIEYLGMPFLTTPCGRSILPEDHPLALGLVGMYVTKVGKKVYDEADVLVTVGSRMEQYQSLSFTAFPEAAKFIQIEIDPFQIGRNWIPTVAIVGDAKLVLSDLVSGLYETIKKRKLEDMPRLKAIIEAKRDYEAEVLSECMTEAIPISTKRVVKEMNNVFGKNTILVNENGSQDSWSYYFPHYKVLDIWSTVPMGEQTCLGAGVVGAIAAKLTRPTMNVICPTGDGAFQMYSKELATAAQYNTGVTWVILNNFSFGSDREYITKQYGYYPFEFKVQPDFAKIAEGSKCYGERVERPSELKSALERALKANKEATPAVLDVIIDTEHPSGFGYYSR